MEVKEEVSFRYKKNNKHNINLQFNKINLLCFFIHFLKGTASEATLVALLGAKVKKIQQVKAEHPEWTENEIVGKLVAYGSGK